VATTGIIVSSVIVAVAEKNAVTTGMRALSSIVTVVKETWLLPAFSGLYTVSLVSCFLDLQSSSTVAVVEENWLLHAFGR